MTETFDFSTLDHARGGATEEFFHWRRRAFPFFTRKICLTHASVSPIPAASQNALVEYAGRLALEGQFDHVHDAIYFRCKERIARLLQINNAPAAADEIAFAGSTSHALGLVATSLDWKPGDNCVVADGDFPANVTIWKNLQHTHGVELRLIPYRPHMDLTLEDVKPLVDKRTRLVSLASCNFLTGYAPDLRSIGQWLRSQGVLFCVDAIQTLGAVRCDFEFVDFVCADSHKWLLGPNGIALLWARREAMQNMRPAIFGWLAGKERDSWYAYDTTPIDSAERFEPGARNYLGVIAFDASLAVLESLGEEAVEQRVVYIRDYAAARLAEKGLNVLWTPSPEIKSGIVSFRANSDEETTALYKKLDEKFALSLRSGRDGNTWIRISAHGMNCVEDIDLLAQSL